MQNFRFLPMKKFTLLAFFALVSFMAAHAGTPDKRMKAGAGEPISFKTAPLSGLRGQPLKGTLYPGERQIRLGENNPLRPPFCETFDNFRENMEHDDFPRYFQTVDANNDNRCWGLYNYAGTVENPRPTGRCAYMLFPLDKSVGHADDWLITRAIQLEAGKYYRISIDAGLYSMPANPNTPEKVEVRCGMFNSPDNLDTQVIPETEVKSSRFEKLDGWFVPPFTGKYYIGVHGVTPYYDNYYNYLFVDNISMEAPREATVPAKVSEVTITNDPDGSTALDITFRTPSADLAGAPLTGQVGVSILRGETEIYNNPSLSPDGVYSFRDIPETEGEYLYTFRAYNESGTGADLLLWRYAGSAAPAVPVVTDCSETASNGVSLEWTVPAADVNGNPINPGLLTYNVYDVSDGSPVPVMENLKEPRCEMAVEGADDGQLFAMYYVTAVFRDKESAPSDVSSIAVGKPYTLPYHNSFTLDDYDRYLLFVEQKATVTWRFLDNHSDPKAQDGDNGFVAMVGNYPDETCEMTTGKIDFSQATLPALSFYTFVYDGDENEINIHVTDVSTGEKKSVRTIYLNQFANEGWNKTIVPLEEFAGKTVMIGLEGVIRTHGYIPVDNMRVEQLPETDLSVGEISYPRGADADKEFEIYVDINNTGSATVSGYKVSLLRNGSAVSTVDGPEIASLVMESVLFRDKLSATSAAHSRYEVRIEAAGDSNPDDNVSEPFYVNLVVPTYPVVTDLQCSGEKDDVLLQWNVPDMTKGGPERATEDFESYEAFDNKLSGGWSMIDGDNGFIGGFNGLEMPIDLTRQAWWVMDDAAPYGFIMPRSGHKLLAQMYVVSSDGNEIPCDDWLVSPELYGGTQTVSFWAKSASSVYGLETMEVYSSDGGTATGDFRLLQSESEVPVDWTQYFVVLPAGSRHFAIRCNTPAGYMLLLDDVSFVPAGTPVRLTLKGYNVYRNGVKQNDAPVTGTHFSTSQTGENDSYYVTAVYDAGESVPSNVVGFGTTGIDDAAAGNPDRPARYYNLQGVRVDASHLAPGIYIRVTGHKSQKVLVP